MLLQWLRAEPNARHARIAVLREHTPLMGEDDAVTHALYRAGADLVIDSTGGRFSVLKWLMLLGTDGPSGALN